MDLSDRIDAGFARVGAEFKAVRAEMPTGRAETIGDGVTTLFTITHNLGTKDVHITLLDRSDDYSDFMADTKRPTDDTVTVEFQDPPDANSVRVLVSPL